MVFDCLPHEQGKEHQDALEDGMLNFYQDKTPEKSSWLR